MSLDHTNTILDHDIVTGRLGNQPRHLDHAVKPDGTTLCGADVKIVTEYTWDHNLGKGLNCRRCTDKTIRLITANLNRRNFS